MGQLPDGVQIAVCCGGTAAEAEVSLATGRMVAEALERCGAKVTVVEPDGSLVELLRDGGADVVFPALHGPLGEDGCLQGLLEFHHVPYVGSGVAASACANDKIIAKRLFRDVGLPWPGDVVVRQDERDTVARVRAEIGADTVVKPPRQGSAIGVRFAHGPDELAAALEAALGYGPDVLVEELVTGSEVTAGVLDLAAGGAPLALPLIEIRTPEGSWYDYAHRYTAGLSQHVIPAPLPSEVYACVQQTAVAAHEVLGCRHLSRADFVVTGSGRIVLLEVNTMPGMTPTSLYPDAARHAGYPFDTLVATLVADALGRARTEPASQPG